MSCHGQEPRLLVDFLLGRVEELVGGDTKWARERLQASAGWHKALSDQQVRDPPLQEGDLVLVHNTNAKGRHKIQHL